MKKSLIFFLGSIGIIFLGAAIFFLERQFVFCSVPPTLQQSQQDKDEPQKCESKEPVSSNETIVFEAPHTVRIASAVGKLLYMNGSAELILYDPVSREKRVLMTSARIVDYDISRDGTFIAYSQIGDGSLSLSSGISILNVQSGNTVDLESDPIISDTNPVFFPDGKRILYVHRVIDDTNTPSDGEIWIRGISATGSSGHRILGNNREHFINLSSLQKVIDHTGEWNGDFFCIDQKEIMAPKIGIDSVSEDGKHIVYKKADWAGECSGLWSRNFFANADGSQFFTPQYNDKQQFVFQETAGSSEIRLWKTKRIFWLSGGMFVALRSTELLTGGDSAVLYGPNQKEILTLYNNPIGGPYSVFSPYIFDIRSLESEGFLVAYRDGTHKGIIFDRVETLKDISSDDFSKEKRIMSLDWKNDLVSDVNIINENMILYKRYDYGDGRVHLMIHDFSRDEDVDVDNLN